MDIDILPAVEGDAAEMADLINSCYRGDSSRKGWTTEADLLDGGRTDAAAVRELLKRADTTILKCVRDNRIIGTVELRRENHRLYLGMLTVEPDLQGAGIGKKLLHAAEEHATARSCNTIFMTVISVRKELIDWYVRHGYKLTGERKEFKFNEPRFGIPKQKLEFVVLEKRLGPQSA